MMFPTIDSQGFADGSLSDDVVNEFNQHKVVQDEIPDVELTGFQRWKWVDGAWVATDDLRGHTWYNPANTDQEHRPAAFDDAPPAGWVYWAPGENKVVPEAEATAKAWAVVRVRRNALLAASDWVVTKAMEQGVPVASDWLVYRQALRDITDQGVPPESVVWPIKPE